MLLGNRNFINQCNQLINYCYPCARKLNTSINTINFVNYFSTNGQYHSIMYSNTLVHCMLDELQTNMSTSVSILVCVHFLPYTEEILVFIQCLVVILTANFSPTCFAHLQQDVAKKKDGRQHCKTNTDDVHHQ